MKVVPAAFITIFDIVNLEIERQLTDRASGVRRDGLPLSMERASEFFGVGADDIFVDDEDLG